MGGGGGSASLKFQTIRHCWTAEIVHYKSSLASGEFSLSLLLLLFFDECGAAWFIIASISPSSVSGSFPLKPRLKSLLRRASNQEEEQRQW